MRTRLNTRKGRVSESILVSKNGSVKTQYHSSAAAPPPPPPWDYVWPMQSAAAELREKGYGIRWVAAGEKFPKEKEWSLTSQEPKDYCPGDNLAVMLGAISGGGAGSGLVCVDLDGERARELADEFLPETGMIDGRRRRCGASSPKRSASRRAGTTRRAEGCTTRS
jgi:hypothetical protein